MLASLRAGPLLSLLLEFCPRGFFLSYAYPKKILEINYLYSKNFGHDGMERHCYPQSFAPFGFLTLLLCLQDLYHRGLDHLGLRRTSTASGGFASNGARPLLGTAAQEAPPPQ
jgi:hypothetical protein